MAQLTQLRDTIGTLAFSKKFVGWKCTQLEKPYGTNATKLNFSLFQLCHIIVSIMLYSCDHCGIELWQLCHVMKPFMPLHIRNNRVV